MRIFSTFALLLIFAAVSRAQTISLVNTGAVGNLRPPINEDGQAVYQNNAPATALYLGKPGTPIQMVLATNGPIAGSPPYSFNGLVGRRIANGTNQVAFYESRTRRKHQRSIRQLQWNASSRCSDLEPGARPVCGCAVQHRR